MHYHHVEDSRGELVELIPFCCDNCNRQWCNDNGATYAGWNGCQEGSDSVEFCANCGTVAGGNYQCNCQRDNVVVNRFRSARGIKCRHKNWLQLPMKYPAPIPVIFRAERHGRFKADVTACFPTIPGSPGLATCYQHIGQHSSYCREWYNATRPATETEFADLLAELQSIGYDNLKIYKRETARMRAERKTTEESTI
jgi:hypothetical protein